jgi:hypothetical protein
MTGGAGGRTLTLGGLATGGEGFAGMTFANH